MNFFKPGAQGSAALSPSRPDAHPVTPARTPAADSFAPLAAVSKLLPTESAAKPAAASADKPAASGSVLGPSLRFKGELKAEEDLLILGRLEGSIHHTKTLTIGAEGVVKGDTRARVLIIDGTVDGDLYALESISVRVSARVNGNLHAPRVAIADGATFNGRIEMSNAARAARVIVERQAAATHDEPGAATAPPHSS